MYDSIVIRPEMRGRRGEAGAMPDGAGTSRYPLPRAASDGAATVNVARLRWPAVYRAIVALMQINISETRCAS